MARYDAQDDSAKVVIRSVKPGQLAEIIKRYEDMHSWALVDTLGSDSARLNADDQAALEQLNLRQRSRGTPSGAIDARVIWERDAAPGRMARLLGACHGSEEELAQCQAFLLIRSESDPSRICVDGHFLPADVSAVQSSYDQPSAKWGYYRTSKDEMEIGQNYSYKDEIGKWLKEARTGCVNRPAPTGATSQSIFR